VAKSWQTSAVRQILCSGRIAGLREHHGQVIGPAVWPAIITPAERDCVLARIAARSVTKTRAPRTYLLSGLLRCGRCGNRLFSQARHVNPDNRCHAPLPARPLRCSRRTPVPLLAGRVCVGRSPPPSSAIPRSIPAHTRSMSGAQPAFEDPSFLYRGGLVVAGWGRKPPA
jgi:hypothetical protein